MRLSAVRLALDTRAQGEEAAGTDRLASVGPGVLALGHGRGIQQAWKSRVVRCDSAVTEGRNASVCPPTHVTPTPQAKQGWEVTLQSSQDICFLAF